MIHANLVINSIAVDESRYTLFPPLQLLCYHHFPKTRLNFLKRS